MLTMKRMANSGRKTLSTWPTLDERQFPFVQLWTIDSCFSSNPALKTVPFCPTFNVGLARKHVCSLLWWFSLPLPVFFFLDSTLQNVFCLIWQISNYHCRTRSKLSSWGSSGPDVGDLRRLFEVPISTLGRLHFLQMYSYRTYIEVKYNSYATTSYVLVKITLAG